MAHLWDLDWLHVAPTMKLSISMFLLILLYRSERVIFRKLCDTLYLDEAVTGEAAATAMGLVMAGSMHPTAFKEMKQVG